MQSRFSSRSCSRLGVALAVFFSLFGAGCIPATSSEAFRVRSTPTETVNELEVAAERERSYQEDYARRQRDEQQRQEDDRRWYDDQARRQQDAADYQRQQDEYFRQQQESYNRRSWDSNP